MSGGAEHCGGPPLTAPSSMRCAGVLLAGGASTRMGRPKATLPIDGDTFATRIARRLAEAGCAPRIVVAGRHARETFAAIASAPAVDGKGPDREPTDPHFEDCVTLVNDRPERGQLSSLRVALEWLVAHAPRCAAALVALVDHPAVRSETYRALCKAAASAPPGRTILLPTCKGRRGHPVVFARAVWPELLALPEGSTARAVVHADPARILEIEVSDPGIHRDVDTPADLAGL